MCARHCLTEFALSNICASQSRSYFRQAVYSIWLNIFNKSKYVADDSTYKCDKPFFVILPRLVPWRFYVIIINMAIMAVFVEFFFISVTRILRISSGLVDTIRILTIDWRVLYWIYKVIFYIYFEKCYYQKSLWRKLNNYPYLYLLKRI